MLIRHLPSVLKLSKLKKTPDTEKHSPCKLDILVDGTGNYHSDNGVVPGTEEHKSKTQAHPQEGKSPIEWNAEADRHMQYKTFVNLEIQLFLHFAVGELTSGRT